MAAAAVLVAALGVSIHVVAAQTGPAVNFRSDVQPLLKERCLACHGPARQMSGLRLDQRSSVLGQGTRTRVHPGSSATSSLYLRLVSSEYGPQMPPTGALQPAEIALIQAWIDQGAEWPDDLAGDVPARRRPDPAAVRLMDALRDGDRQRFKEVLAASSQAADRPGIGGSTPLMYAAMYGDGETLRLLLDSGADPDVANDAGATALMWAVSDEVKVALLLEYGADPGASASTGQTALTIAAARFGSSRIVKLLLDYGANPSVGGRTLVQAANAGDPDVFRMLVERGADMRAAGGTALMLAGRANCDICFRMLLGAVSQSDLNRALVGLAAYGDVQQLKALLDQGADVDARLTNVRRDMARRTPLMLAASSDLVPADAVRLLIDRGADLDVQGPDGETALDLARRNGHTPVVDLLLQRGAWEAGEYSNRHVTPGPASSVRVAVERSLPVLQRSDVTFIQKTGCASCHNNTFTAMAVAAARASRITVNEETAAAQRKVIASLLDGNRDAAVLGSEIPNTASNILVGLAAENHAPDLATDAMAYCLKGLQLPDGRWRNYFVDHRPPIQSSDIEVTATAVRALQVYAPRALRAEYEKAIRRATEWLMSARPRTTDERALQLLGLGWGGVNVSHRTIRTAAEALIAEQRTDGGWAQLPTLASDAYATGQALVALQEAGGLPTGDPVYRRGVQFLLNTQLEDGSWYVKTRSLAFQPYFESGFPHGPDQWVSMAATNWASIALALAIR
jgi:ankyrin repeat protein